ncbi:TonB-dependent receptor domain-containing protein [Maribacter sp. 2307ULW6-5]|uniref:TonB-dependent receptor domain-containing protein n=1 Tax=Maribacter sp. 2307ULW6-5 TaxID=3386275 RepID=UPI0039BD5700
MTDLNVSVSGGTKKLSYFVSGGKLDQTGITPLEQFGRKSFRSNISAELTDKFSIDVSGTYINSGGRRNQRGSNVSGIMLGLLRTTPTFDNSNGAGASAVLDPATYQLPDGTQRSYRAGVYDSPYWTVVKNPTFDDVNRFIGNFQFNYNPTDWLTIRGLYGYDRFTDSRKSGLDVNSAGNAIGQLQDRDESNEDITSQLLFLINKDLSDKWNFGATFGYDQYRNRRLARTTNGFGLTIPGFFHVSNTATQTNFENYGQRELRGLLSNITLGYNNLLFVNGSFRNDWSSTLPSDNNSFQSYGVGGSFVFSELFQTRGNWFNFGKLRGSWGRNGNDAPAFATDTYYGTGSAGGDGFIDNNVFPLFGQVAFERSSLLGNNQITPELTTEYEIGAEFRFFDSRLNLDVAYYDRTTEDQIIEVSQPATTGFTNRTINAGVISNTGWEISADIIPVRTENFRWNVNLNYTAMENVVEELVEGIEPILLAGFTSTSSRAVPGESYGAIFGNRWLRDENGNQLIDASNGLAIADPTNGVIGDPIPDFTLGVRNTFSYKNLSLTTLFDYRSGGDVWCGTCGILDYFGTSQATSDLRETSYVVDGITANFTNGTWVPTGQQNTTSVPYADPAGGLGANRWVRYGFGGVAEDYVFDGSFFKLREVALTYNIPTRFVERAGISNASITVAGRNLLLITDYPGIDPETNLSGDSNGIGLDYFNQPFTESYSLALKVTF